MSSESQPTEKELVQALRPLLRVENRNVCGKNGPRAAVVHNIYRSPKGELCTSREDKTGEYTCQQAEGYRNSFMYLLKCCAGSSQDYLLEKFVAVNAKVITQNEKFFSTKTSKTISVNPRERAVYDYIGYIIQ